MNEREYNRLKQQIESDYKKKIEALEIIRRMAKEATREGPAVQQVNGARAGTIMGAVSHVLGKISGEFNLNDVIKLIVELHPEIKQPLNPTSVSGCLKKLERQGSIDLVQAGSGKRPNKYRHKTESDQGSQSLCCQEEPLSVSAASQF